MIPPVTPKHGTAVTVNSKTELPCPAVRGEGIIPKGKGVTLL